MNTIPPALQSGIQGVQRGMDKLDRHAAEIASADHYDDDPATGTDLAESLVGLKVSELQVALAMKILKAVDQTIGSLLDTRA